MYETTKSISVFKVDLFFLIGILINRALTLSTAFRKNCKMLMDLMKKKPELLSILDHPCSLMAYFYLLGVFCPSVIYIFRFLSA